MSEAVTADEFYERFRAAYLELSKDAESYAAKFRELHSAAVLHGYSFEPVGGSPARVKLGVTDGMLLEGPVLYLHRVLVKGGSAELQAQEHTS